MEHIISVLDRKLVPTHVHRHAPIALIASASKARRAGWFPRIVRTHNVANAAAQLAAKRRALPLAAAAAPPSSPKPRSTRHDVIAMRRACEAQAFSAYAHAHGRDEYERRDYQRAAQWQRLSADATRGASLYRELGHLLLSAGRD